MSGTGQGGSKTGDDEDWKLLAPVGGGFEEYVNIVRTAYWSLLELILIEYCRSRVVKIARSADHGHDRAKFDSW